MKMSPSCRCCGCGQCRIARDDFDRPELGSDWTVVDGAWSVAAGELVTASSLARVVHVQSQPPGVPAHVVTTKVRGADPGDELRVLVAIAGPDDFLEARATLESAGGCGTLRLIHVLGGVDTELATIVVPELVPGVWHTLRVCYHWPAGAPTGTLAAVVTTATGMVRTVAAAVSASGLQVGLGTGTIAAEARFDHFCWQRHRGTSTDLPCPECAQPECHYSSDAFDRSDLGCGWETVSGSWSLVGGELQATAPGLLRHTARQPHASPTMRATVKLRGESSGDRLRVLVALADADHLLAAEFELGSPCGTLRLIHIDAGVATPLGTDIPVVGLVPGAWHQVTVCFGQGWWGGSTNPTVLSASVLTSGGARRSFAQEVSGGTWGAFAGLAATQVNSSVRFDDFSLQEVQSAANLTCPACGANFGCGWGGSNCTDPDAACDWEAVAGTWTCQATSDSQAIHRFRLPQPHGDVRTALRGTVVASGAGSEVLFYVAYQDATTYLAGKLIMGDPCGRVQLLQNGVVLAELPIEPLTPGAFHSLCVGYDGTTLRADVAPGAATAAEAAPRISRHLAHPATVGPDARFVAVGTGANYGTASFAVAAEIPYDPVVHPECATCDTCDLAHVVGTDPSLGCVWQPTSGKISAVPEGVRLATVDGYAALAGNDGSNQAFVSVRLQGTVSGQVLRVYVHDDGTRTGPWVELEFKDAPQTTVLRASTGQTAIYPVRPLEQHRLTICLEGTSLIANLDPQPGFVPALHAWVRGTLLSPATGKYLVCQLRGVGGPATFDQVHYRRLSVSRPIFPFAPGKCGSCYAVCTCCEQEIMPTEMLLELEGLVGYPFPDGSPCCVNYNQAYFLGALTNCFFDWDRGAIDACTKPGFVNLSWECFPSSVRITATLYYQTDYPFPGATLTWRTTLPRPVDCLGFDRLPLPFLSQSGSNQRCDPSSSIAYLTSL